MNFSDLPDGTKFACLSLKEGSLADGLSEPLDLLRDRSLWALFAPPFEIPQYWQNWLGSLQTRRFSGSNLFLFATLPSGASVRERREKVDSLFYAILMHGVPDYQAGLLLIGEKRSGTADVQSVRADNQYYRPAKFGPAEIDGDTLKSAAAAAGGLQTIYREQQNYRRLKQGFEAWVKGVSEEVGIYRLHQFVRAVEAVVKPSTDQVREQFIKRCNLFAVRSAQVLEELYDLRTCVEHMNDWRDVLTQYSSESEQDTIGWKRAYQAELLAGHVYLRILKESKLLENFIDDERIDQFWEEPSWGEPVDLEIEASRRFVGSDSEL
jgi:hypothetical protein